MTYLLGYELSMCIQNFDLQKWLIHKQEQLEIKRLFYNAIFSLSCVVSLSSRAKLIIILVHIPLKIYVRQCIQITTLNLH